MLARADRLTTSADFKAAARGRRTTTPCLVAHWREDAEASPPRIGFVVSRAVGNAVTRNRVKRRLRNLSRERLGRLPGPGLMVVRAKPAAASATYAELGAELDQALARWTSRASSRGA